MRFDRYVTGLLVSLAATMLLLSFPAYVHFAAMHMPGLTLPAPLRAIGPFAARSSLAFTVVVATLTLIFAALNWREATTVTGFSLLALVLAALTMVPFWYYRANITENRTVTIEKIIEKTVEKVVDNIIEKPVEVRTPAYISTIKMEIIQLPINHKSIQIAYDRNNFHEEVTENFLSFHNYIYSLYLDAKPYIDSHWGIDSEKLKRSAFYVMAVGTLFEYGNKDQLGIPGCSYWNERIGGRLSYQQSQRQLLRAGIGCCDDYAYVLKAMLDLDGIESRLMTGSGHMWVEIVVDGQKFSADANTGLITASGWDELATANRIVVWRAPLSGAMPSSGERYRPMLATFSNYILDRISDGGFPAETVSMPDFPTEDGAPSAEGSGYEN